MAKKRAKKRKLLRKKKQSKSKRHSRSRAKRAHRSKRNNKRRSRRNPLDKILRAGMCAPRRWNPGVSFTDREPTFYDDVEECSCLECPSHGHLISATRKNAGWTFRGGKPIPHEQELGDMYHRRPKQNPGFNVFRAGMCDPVW